MQRHLEETIKNNLQDFNSLCKMALPRVHVFSVSPCKASTNSCSSSPWRYCFTNVYDSTTATRDLRRANNNSAISRDIHDILGTYPCTLRLSWFRQNTLPAHTAAHSACHPAFVPQPLPLPTIDAPELSPTERRSSSRHTSPNFTVWNGPP